ncbi:MAG: hypothetical protein ACMUEM_07650 [Flavobacteriales bacterium AspAUS03]
MVQADLFDKKKDKIAILGWFVGWIQKDEKCLGFAHYLEGNGGATVATGQHTREGAKICLMELIQQRSTHETSN